MDQNKIAGVDSADKAVKDKIYNQYLQAFKQGVYNYIKLEYDPSQEKKLPRPLFLGGGTNMGNIESQMTTIEIPQGEIVSSGIDQWAKELLDSGRLTPEDYERFRKNRGRGNVYTQGAEAQDDVVRVTGSLVENRVAGVSGDTLRNGRSRLGPCMVI